MRKVIIGITSIILCLSIISLCYFTVQYKTYYRGNSQKDIKKVEEKIKGITVEIKKKKEEVEKIKNENKEKVDLLEVWEKEFGKVKKDS